MVENDWFHESGKLKVSPDEVFTNDGDLNWNVWQFLTLNLEKFPSDSQAVQLYYAESAAGNTHGNYIARTLYNRGL